MDSYNVRVIKFMVSFLMIRLILPLLRLPFELHMVVFGGLLLYVAVALQLLYLVKYIIVIFLLLIILVSIILPFIFERAISAALNSLDPGEIKLDELYEKYLLITGCEESHGCGLTKEDKQMFFDRDFKGFCIASRRSEMCACSKCSWGPTAQCGELLDMSERKYQNFCLDKLLKGLNNGK